MSQLEKIFGKAKSEGRAAFIAYYPAGFPTTEQSVENIVTLAKYTDVIEVGIPFSDPMMDGPVIQQAADVALANGFKVKDTLEVIRRATEAGANCVIMTYWNLILQYGPEKFAKELAEAGGLGSILPDLPPEMAGRWTAACKEHGLDPVYLVAPSSTPERLELTTRASSGFIYAASHMGVTGTQEEVSTNASALVARCREVTEKPVAVGLGVRNGAQAAEIAKFADGVIVGSALIKAVEDGTLEQLAAELAEGVRQ